MAKFAAKDVWHKILNYQTLDLVESAYYARHKREPSKTRIREITSNFIQAQEYFINAENSSLSVRPLLLYYGVLGLSRGLILMLQANLSEAAMKQSHGINTLDWQQTLSGGLPKIGELKVKFSDGTFWELLKSIENKSYLKSNSSRVHWQVSYEPPEINTGLKFKDLVATLPDLRKEYKTWSNEEPAIAQMTTLKTDHNERFYDITIPKNYNTSISIEKIENIFSLPILDTKDTKNEYLIKVSTDENLFIVQLFDGHFGIGSLFISKLISTNLRLATIPTLYCASYYLGMLCRYFPSIWISLGRTSKGDCIFPLINKLLSLIRDRYPEIILEFLEGPYDFETKNESSKQKDIEKTDDIAS